MSLTPIIRRASRQVWIGHVPVGGDAPVMIQSMTNTDTADAAATAQQVFELAMAGSEVVRITVNTAEAAAAVAEVPQFEYLPTPLRRRKAFSNAAGAGQCVLEIKPQDGKASAELDALISALF